ncbi:hypothetical protein, partial [Collimonas silvisoli]|uniref:hypothetical protein n=1 Tax=Collimonas silvisoli TaxID=2825884 RepID=UPI001B8C7146
MPTKTITSPEGEKLRLIAQHTTTKGMDTSYKPLVADSETIEVLVSDSRLHSLGSQFGHVAIEINDMVYGRAPDSWDEDNRKHYLFRQAYRATIGFVLRVSPEDKKILLAEIKKREKKNLPYDLAINSCSSNASEILGAIGIIAYDPRWTAIATPADMVVALRKAKRLV